MIQGVINRMASVSATFKGLSATLFAAIATVVITVGVNNRLIAIVAVWATIALFSIFDWYYFYQEKHYRKLYEEVKNGCHECNFDMQPPKYSEITKRSSLKSISLVAFYTPLFIVLLLFSLLIGFSIL